MEALDVGLSGIIEYSLPVVSEFNGGKYYSDLFLISGGNQSYKTTLATEIVSCVCKSIRCSEVVWIDCSMKFPIDLIKIKGFDLDKFSVFKCRSSEEILFCLEKVAHMMDNADNMFKVFVVDDINSNFWLDRLSNNGIQKKMRNLVERLVSVYGLIGVITSQDIVDFDQWYVSPVVSYQIIKTFQINNGQGIAVSGSNNYSFKITNNREIQWGKQVSNVEETNYGENDE